MKIVLTTMYLTIICSILVTTNVQAALILTSPECVVKGIVTDNSQRTETQEQSPQSKTFHDATVYILEQNYINEVDRQSNQLSKTAYNCDIKNTEMLYQLKDEYVTFLDPSLQKTLDGQCVQGHAKLSKEDNTLGLWLYDLQVLNPESCVITQSQ